MTLMNYQTIQELIRDDSAQILKHYTDPSEESTYYRFYGYCIEPVLRHYMLCNELDDSTDSMIFKQLYDECIEGIKVDVNYKRYIRPLLLHPGFDPLEDVKTLDPSIHALFDTINRINRDCIVVKNDGKVSLSITSDVITDAFKLVTDSFVEKYGFDYGSISGYHISILDTYELEDIDDKSFLDELESIINPLSLSDFKVKTAVSQDFPPYKMFYMLKFQSPELNNLRMKYGLDSITTHITLFRETRAAVKDETLVERYNLNKDGYIMKTSLL